MIHALINRIYRAGRGEDSDYYKRSPPPSISITETHRSPLHKSPNSRLPLHRLVVRNHSPDSREYRERGYKRNALRRNFHTFIQRLQWYSRIRLLRWIVGAILFAFLLFWSRWETHIEIMFYSRSWIKNEIKKLEPLAGCFEKHRISSQYNLTLARGPKTHEIQAGLPLRFGMDCYDFAGTITTPAPTAHQTGRQIFHSYWRSDLVQFGERQAWMLKSFFATQDLSKSTLILWSNGDLTRNQYVSSYLRMYPNSFQTTIVDVTHLARQTALSGSPLLAQKDSRAWVDGDLVRLLVTWEYGGVWIDMDSLLTRDLSPLLDHEFVTQWDCYDKLYTPFNGALLHFFKHSPYLCEAFHIMARSPPPRPGTTDWGSTLYLKLWRRLVAEGIPPFKILPFCFSDGRSCRLDNRLPDPFKPDPKTWADGRSLLEGKELDVVLNQKVFSVHLHNQWEKKFPPNGWVERLLLRKYETMLTGG